ncbi:endonuclease Q family protein [Patescibacteria group bacterium]|nr:endonuclease Q family protein [Patescibacteria group bacterium]
MQIIADLHLHSRFSRAVSPQMTIDGIADWAVKKGIGLVATGDWTHPMWMREIGEKLEEDGSGLLKQKEEDGRQKTEKFLLSTEISCIYSQSGKTRRVHVLVWVPTIASAQKISQELTKRGCNLMSDGRPIIGLSLINLSELILTVEPQTLIVPAHIWTPWFSVYGKMGGFESLEEAFGEFAKNIYAIETGLSSSPDMNWRIKELDSRTIVSFSDAHSGPKLGREATIFELPEITYKNIKRALESPTHAEVANENLDASQNVAEVARPNSRVLRSLADARAPSAKNSNLSALPATECYPHIAYTIEFYPEEGKYHYTGHRLCNVRLTPEEVSSKGTTCPVCGKPLTQGVMQRVEELAGRKDNELQICKSTNDKYTNQLSNVKIIKSKTFPNKVPFVMLVPLQEIIAEAIGSPVASPKTQAQYTRLVLHFNGEFNVLLHASIDEIGSVSTKEIADGVRKVRIGDIVVDPGYDGVFGIVNIWKSEEEKALVDRSKEQLGLF